MKVMNSRAWINSHGFRIFLPLFYTFFVAATRFYPLWLGNDIAEIILYYLITPGVLLCDFALSSCAADNNLSLWTVLLTPAVILFLIGWGIDVLIAKKRPQKTKRSGKTVKKTKKTRKK